MKTLVESACENITTPEMESVAKAEAVALDIIRSRIEQGQIVIPSNQMQGKRTVGVGKGLKTKVNASIGTSSDIIDLDSEIRKARAAEECGADTLMELSVGGDLDRIRREIIAAVNIPVGNVPLYQAFCEATRKYGDPDKLTEELLFEMIERQCEDGISFMAIHCGINRYTLERLEKQGYRYGGLVSKGGAAMVSWMLRNNKENPLYEKFDRVIQILRKYDVILSLGNGLRAGAVHDSMDRAQIQELIINCELAEIGRKMGCQMMVEGPGHVPLDEIAPNIVLQKRMSNEAPYYMLGPITTDIAPGYDHIASAIGIASSSSAGADLVCYITPAEHLALPNEEDVRVGVKVARVAAHVGDMVKLKEKASRQDLEISKARRDLDWTKMFSLAIFGEEAQKIRSGRQSSDERGCSMCGEFCAVNKSGAIFEKTLKESYKG